MKIKIFNASIWVLLLCSCSQNYKNTVDPLEERIDSIISKMTVQEKIEQLYYKTDGNERLGIPQFTGSDGPHGIGNNAKGFSSFPVTIGMSATWDPVLITKVGRAISLEQAARGRDRIAGPTLDMLIDPRMGRAPETIGEDPYLGARISTAFVQGQNTTSVFGTIKHYNLNTYELNRRTNNYLVDKRSLVDFWGYHWKKVVQEGGALSVMCAYNWINGDKCAENSFLIKKLLRDIWGFNFYTMCDWGGFSDTQKALNSELDFCEGNDLYINELPNYVKDGTIDMSLLDRAVRNVLRTKIIAGMFDSKPCISKDVIDSREHRNLVYESGLKGLVLLKNSDGILPLDQKNIKSLAIIGPNARNLPLDGHSSSNVIPSYKVSVEDAFRNKSQNMAISYSKGCNINDNDKSLFGEAIAIAKKADYVVFVGGLDESVEGEGYFINPEADEKGGEFVNKPDRPSGTVLLPGMQNELIKEIAKVNPNVILVVISGGICSVTPVIDDVKGLLYAFYPGQEAGNAIVDVLYGAYNPSGKLPVTMPKDDSQIIPISPDFKDMAYKGVGYRWFDSHDYQPEFAFGYGLSYTDFEYSNLQFDKLPKSVGETISVSFDLKNVGDVAGEEVAQLYLSALHLDQDIKMPQKELRGFSKVYLNPGETKRISFTLSPDELYVFDEGIEGYIIPSGEYKILIGGSSDNLPLSLNFSLNQAEHRKPDLKVCNIRTIPTYPKENEEVYFAASVLNGGTAATSIGDRHLVKFFVDDVEVARYYSDSLSIGVGGMKFVCGENYRPLKWTSHKGKFKLKAEVYLLDRDELCESNNSTESSLSIPNGRAQSSQILENLTIE